MRPRKYHVELTENERKELNDLTNKGKYQQLKSNMLRFYLN